MTDEIIRLVLDMENSGKTVDEINAALRKMDATAKATGQSLDSMAAAANKAAEAATGLSKSGVNSGQAMMNLGRIVQDFQGGGLMGITNNIESMAMSLGSGAGLAGGATLAVVALTAFMPLIKDLFKSFSGGATQTEAAAMEELANKTHRTADETKRLNQYKKEQASLQQILASQTKEERTTEQAVREAFAGHGPAIQKGIAAGLVLRREGEKMTAAEIAAMDPAEVIRRAGDAAAIAASRTGVPGASDAARASAVAKATAEAPAKVEAARQKAQERVDAFNMEQAGRILAAAPTNQAAQIQVRMMARQAPGNFPPGLELGLEGAEPAVRARDAQEKAKAKAADDARKRKADEIIADNKLVDDLNREGARIEATTLRENKQQAEQADKARFAAELKKAKAQFAGPAGVNAEGAMGIQHMGRQAGMDLGIGEANRIFLGKMAQQSAVQSQGLGQIVYLTQGVQQNIAMWERFQQMAGQNLGW